MLEEVEVEVLFCLKPRHFTRLITMKSLLKLMQVPLDKKEVTGRCTVFTSHPAGPAPSHQASKARLVLCIVFVYYIEI